MSVARVDGGDYLPDWAFAGAEVGALFNPEVESEPGPGQIRQGGSAEKKSLLDALDDPASLPNADEQQKTDGLARDLVDAVHKQGNLPAHASPAQIGAAVQAAVRDAHQHGASGLPLFAAADMALAKLASEQKALPEDQRDEFIDNVGRNVLGAALLSNLDAAQQAKLARLMIDSAPVRAVEAPRSVLTTALKAVVYSPAGSTSEGKLDAIAKSALERIILSSTLAQVSRPFLSRYLAALHQLRGHPSQQVPAAAVAFGDAIAQHGEAQQFPKDVALHNAIGRALHLPERLPQSEAERERAKRGEWELFDGLPWVQAGLVSAAIRLAGGPDAKVTFLPVVFQKSPRSPLEKYSFFRVTDAHGKATFVDPFGHTAPSIETLLPVLGYGISLFPKDGKLTVAPDGSVPYSRFERPAPPRHVPPAGPRTS